MARPRRVLERGSALLVLAAVLCTARALDGGERGGPAGPGRQLAKPPVSIKGPRTKVPNCPRCVMQHVPDMCSYQAGTEPAGARWEDYQAPEWSPPPTAIEAGPEAGATAGEAAAAAAHERGGGWLGLRDRGRGRGQGQAPGSKPTAAAARAPPKPSSRDRVITVKPGKDGVIANAGDVKRALRRQGVRDTKAYMGAIRDRVRKAKGDVARGRSLLVTKARQPTFQPPSAAVAEIARSALAAWKRTPDRCGMWTRSCVERYLARNETLGLPDAHSAEPARDPLLKLVRKEHTPENLTLLAERFPDLQPGELGSCAVVAVGDNMLKQGRGAEIDAHDTVFRYNSPIKAYVADVGSQSDVLYWKLRKNEKLYGQEGQEASRFYMWKDESKFYEFGAPDDWATNSYRGKPLLWPSKLSVNATADVYRQYKAEKSATWTRGTPAGGFKFAMDVLSSGLCKRVDLYGYTASGSGKYFKREMLMKPVHYSGLEHWVYREAQAIGMLCVYD
mmetsp:Transcript_5733/g.14731  ORF Transcript_5733/g.14731 Transcript_5733/m.14731 type:complete len:504 (-) Transcript_5733:107-1618(-)|eukprot:jgi/Tetstr1/460597/TSEL_000522.t1